MDAGVPTHKKNTITGTGTWCHDGGVVWCGAVLSGVVCRNTHNGGEQAQQGLRGHAADIKQHGHWRYRAHKNMSSRNDEDWHRDHSRWACGDSGEGA